MGVVPCCKRLSKIHSTIHYEESPMSNFGGDRPRVSSQNFWMHKSIDQPICTNTPLEEKEVLG